MDEKYNKKIRGIIEKLCIMHRYIEKNIEMLRDALIGYDEKKANIVLEDDMASKKLINDIERECFKILLMQQPVATDFREVSASLKIITDLKRIDEQISDIAEIIVELAKLNAKSNTNLERMANETINIIKSCVDAYINNDIKTAKGLDDMDDILDKLFIDIQADLINEIKQSPDSAEKIIYIMMINKYLERIGDHTVNIGEWIVYSVDGILPK